MNLYWLIFALAALATFATAAQIYATNSAPPEYTDPVAQRVKACSSFSYQAEREACVQKLWDMKVIP
jgi:hypothetical protein